MLHLEVNESVLGVEHVDGRGRHRGAGGGGQYQGQGQSVGKGKGLHAPILRPFQGSAQKAYWRIASTCTTRRTLSGATIGRP